MSLGFPLLVRLRNFRFFCSRGGERDCVLAVFFASFLEKRILDYLAHRPIIQVFTVSHPIGPAVRAKDGHPEISLP